jgi:hypothetical protein
MVWFGFEELDEEQFNVPFRRRYAERVLGTSGGDDAPGRDSM